MTVVGVETTTDNGVHLLVFNPARRYKGDAQCTRSLSMKQKQAILEIYRLHPDELRKYSEFELLLYVSIWRAVLACGSQRTTVANGVQC